MTEAAYLVAAIGALAAAVTSLWVLTQRQTRELVTTFREEAAREREERRAMLAALMEVRARLCGVDECDAREDVPVRLSPSRSSPRPALPEVDPEETPAAPPRKPRQR